MRLQPKEESTNTKTIMSTKLEALWIVGFVDGEGCFNLDVHCHKTAFGGIQLQLEFVVVQHERLHQRTSVVARHLHRPSLLEG